MEIWWVNELAQSVHVLYLSRVGVGPPDQGEDVERDEQAVEEVIRQDHVQVVDLQTQDVVL